MDFSWAGIKQSVREFWGKLTRPQKIITVAAPLVVATALISLLYWANRPEYVVIFSKLSDAEAGTITTKLKDLKVTYQLADNGSSIMVPQKEAAEVRLQLAQAGLPQGSKFSYSESLSQMRVGETDADRKLRNLLGLQTELETTVKSLEGVQDARVHIVLPEPTLFVEKEKAATAGVTLKVAPGSVIGDEKVRAIANLLASSVEGLSVEKVTIVDSLGNVLSDVLSKNNDPVKLTATQLQLQQAKESSIQKSVQSMLDRIYPGKTVVRVNATLDFDYVTTNTVRNGPGAVLSEQTNVERSTNNNTAAVPGVNPNVPNYQTPVNAGTTATGEKSSTTRNFQVDTAQEQRVKNQGDIKHLSVSVMMDADTITEAQANQIRNVVAAAAGIQTNRGDEIQVVALPFDKTDSLQREKEFAAAAQREKLLSYGQIGAGALLALVFVFLILRTRVKHKREERQLTLAAQEALTQISLPTPEQLLEMQRESEISAQAQKSDEEKNRQKVKDAVEGYVQSNPDDAARIIKAWLEEDK